MNEEQYYTQADGELPVISLYCAECDEDYEGVEALEMVDGFAYAMCPVCGEYVREQVAFD